MMAASEDNARKELAEHFQTAVTDHPDVMAECLSIIRLYHLTPSDLFYKYEAFLMARPSGLRAKLATLTLNTVRELRGEIQREQQAKAVANMSSSSSLTTSTSDRTPQAAVGLRKGKSNVSDIGGFLEGLSTPSRPSKASHSTSSARHSNGSTNANIHHHIASSPSGSSFNPTPRRGLETPQRSVPSAASSSSYRPEVVRLAGSPTSNHLETPIGRGSNSLSVPSSPVSPAGSPKELASQLTRPFHLRPQPNSLIETLNAHLSSSNQGVPQNSKPRVTLSSTADPKDWNYRYMFEKTSQRSEALDDAIDDYADVVKDAYGITELGDPHFVSEEDIYTVGRILSQPTDSSKVNAGSLFLESSRLLGSGRRIALRFASPGQLKVRGGAPGVKGFGLFPGCLTCLKGRNGGGGAFVVGEVLLAPPNPLVQTPATELLSYQHGDKLLGQPISMTVAAGPFTLDDDLTFAPLDALVDVVLDERPDALLLLGPFVDSHHPMLVNGAVTRTASEIFREQIANRLQKIVDASPGTVIILIPSVRDMVSRHVAFPQSMLEKEPLGLHKKIKVLPNPCTFSVNEVVVSVSSVDVLFHLRREELFQKADEAEPDPSIKVSGGRDAMAGLVRHVLGQRSFYPIFPPPETSAPEINLDVTHYPLLKMDGSAPDILILPSKLKHFSKVVDSTLVLNPAYLSRPHSAGTYAKILLHPTPKKELESEVLVDGFDQDVREHQVWERARTEIWRI